MTTEYAITHLAKTPLVLRNLLDGLPEEVIRENEGPDTWSPFDVVGHLIVGEKTDWLARTKIILVNGTSRPFAPFDREAQFVLSAGKSLADLLNEFEMLRNENLDELKSLELSGGQMNLKGMHLRLGEVTLSELISTWVVHDYVHIAQICRVIAKQMRNDIGPWIKFISLLQEKTD